MNTSRSAEVQQLITACQHRQRRLAVQLAAERKQNADVAETKRKRTEHDKLTAAVFSLPLDTTSISEDYKALRKRYMGQD